MRSSRPSARRSRPGCAEILRQWADFDARIGIVDRPPDVERGFELTLAPRAP